MKVKLQYLLTYYLGKFNSITTATATAAANTTATTTTTSTCTTKYFFEYNLEACTKLVVVYHTDYDDHDDHHTLRLSTKNEDRLD